MARVSPQMISRTLKMLQKQLTSQAGKMPTSFLSYFARANYKINEKYFFTLSGRVDGSSRFGIDNRYGFFPAGSAGWIITQEDFMAGIKDVLSYLKLRASYGLTGNSGIPDYAHLALYTGVNYAGRNGLEATQLQSRELGWENTAQADIGLDFGFFNNRLTGEIDYYQKKTTDLLLYRTLPSTSGFTGVWSNVGELENKGWNFHCTANNPHRFLYLDNRLITWLSTGIRSLISTVRK